MATGGGKKSTSKSVSKPAAPKIPAVIAKPAAKPAQSINLYGSPATNTRPSTTSQKKTTTTGKKTTGGGTSSFDKQFEAGMKGIKETNKELKKLLEEYNKGLGGGEEDGGGEEEGGGEDPGLAYQKMQDEKARQDAFQILKDVFASYGLDTLADEIERYMKEGIGTGEATLRLKKSQPYKDRFKGNELRLAAGRNVITESEYLDLEDSYSQTLKAYGLQDYFGVGVTPGQRLTRQQKMAEVIGADISAVEFKDRVSTAVDRVKMADPATKNAFQQFYGIGETDLAKYFLDPTRTLVTLKEKALSAEIGGAAIGQGLVATATSAEDLARFGISREQAQAGYSTIAEELPTAAKLGQIYSEEGITYGQTEAEQATFKGLASARRKKERLVAREEAEFQGSAGVGAAGLSTTYLRRGSSAGQF
jgi:hypothetical protein